MTLHEAIKNSDAISKLINTVRGKEELVINATEAIINKNMKGLTKEKKEKCINDKTYIENQIVGIIKALKNGSTIYCNIYDKTDWFEGTVPMYEKALEEEEEFERIKEELSERDENCKRIFEDNDRINENCRKIKEEIKDEQERINKRMGFSNEKEKEEYFKRRKEEDQKRLNKKGFLDYIPKPLKYVGEKIVEAVKFIGEKISNGFNKLKGLFGKKETKETVK